MKDLKRNNFEKLEAVISKAFKTLVTNLTMRAFAEEGGDPTPTPVPVGGEPTPAPKGDPTPIPTPAPALNYEELIARARKEEKEKLYPQINQLKSDLATMTKNNNTNLLEVARLQAELEKAKDNSNDSEWKVKYDTLFNEFEEYKKTVIPEEQLRAELEKEYEVKSYLAEQKAANKDKILPVFADGITGTTKEEVDASIEKALNLTNQAKEQLGVNSNPTPAPQPNAGKPNTPPVVSPNGGFGKGTEDIDFIRNLDLTTPEGRKQYNEWRQKQGLR